MAKDIKIRKQFLSIKNDQGALEKLLIELDVVDSKNNSIYTEKLMN